MTNKFFFAAPGQGKSLIATGEGVARLDNKKSVLSNFPIVTPDKVPKSSRRWESNYIFKPIYDSLIIIDEAQQDYDSTGKKTLDPDEDAFFATTGQNGNDVIIISQGITRVTKAVRDRMNEWHKIKKILDIPFIRDARGKFGYPVLFHVTVWETLEDMQSNNKERIYYSYFVWFNRRVAMSYNTTFFRNAGKPFIPQLWTEYIKEHGNIERLTERIDQERQASFSQVAYRNLSPSRLYRKILDAYLSICNHSRAGKARIQGLYESLAQRIRDRVLPGSHPGGERQRSSPGDSGRLLTHRPHSFYLDRKNGRDQGKPSEGPEVQKLLPGDDQATAAVEVQHEPGLDVAGSRPGMEKDSQEVHTLESLFEPVGVQQGHRHQEMAGEDTGSERCEGCPCKGMIASQDCLECQKE